jgi:acetyl esterase/lipase
LRGHGESTTKKNPKDPQKTVDFSWNKMKNEEFKNMITDLKIAIDFIKESNNKDKLNIDTSNIAIIGSSIGANTALNYAAADASVKALVLISPGANYHDITVEDSMKKYGNRPVLLISSKEDKDSYETCEKLEKLSKSEKKENMSIEGKAHGNGILSENKEIGKTIEKWIVGYLHLKPEDTPSEKKYHEGY